MLGRLGLGFQVVESSVLKRNLSSFSLLLAGTCSRPTGGVSGERLVGCLV
jgi:hypothetical protein